MKNIIKHFLFLGFVLLAIVSCQKDIAPVELTGRWNINNLESNFEVKSEKPSITKIDLRKDNLFIEFKSDGTYTSNAEFGIGEIGLNTEGSVTNTYEYKDKRLELKLIEPSLKTPIILYFSAEKSSADLILISSISDLKDAYKDQVGTFDTLSNELINAIINGYLKLDLKVFLSN
jgi:hypothetical protein